MDLTMRRRALMLNNTVKANYEEILRALVNGTKSSFTIADYPSGVTTLGDYFCCAGISYIEIPVGVSIPAFWLNKYSTLNKVKLEEGTTTLFNFCLQNNKANIILDIPETVTTIGRDALNIVGNDTVILMRPVTPPTFVWRFAGAFKGTMYVPDDSVNDYKQVALLANYVEQIKPLSEYVES